jgi:hypothetical protein
MSIGLAASCKKDQPVPIEIDQIDCANFSYTSASFANWPGVDVTYNTPVFNPSNSNEILFVKGVTSSGISTIVKRNLINNSEVNIVNSVMDKPDWSIKDWIIFNHGDNKISKIKSNGDSLQLLTLDNSQEFNPIWKPNGSQYVYATQTFSSSLNIIAQANGQHLDTVSYFSFYLQDWFLDGSNIIGLSLDHLNVLSYNTNSKLTTTITNNTLDAHSTNLIYIRGCSLTPDFKFVIWSNNSGIYKTNINTKETIKIKAACDSKYYPSISVSPDGQKIIAARVDQNFEHDTIFIKTGLSLIEINSGKEIKIN